MATETVHEQQERTPLETAIRELRAIRTFLPQIAHVIDRAEPRNTEAWQAAQGAAAQIDDCLAALGAGPEEPTRSLHPIDEIEAIADEAMWEPQGDVIYDRERDFPQDTIADEIRMDRLADAESSEFWGEGR